MRIMMKRQNGRSRFFGVLLLALGMLFAFSSDAWAATPFTEIDLTMTGFAEPKVGEAPKNPSFTVTSTQPATDDSERSKITITQPQWVEVKNGQNQSGKVTAFEEGKQYRFKEHNLEDYQASCNSYFIRCKDDQR